MRFYDSTTFTYVVLPILIALATAKLKELVDYVRGCPVYKPSEEK
jgi:hypothetical protein